MKKKKDLINQFYRPELDALRFFAFLSVFFFHWMDYVPVDPVKEPFLHTICTIGAFGVPLFFLLSSFLITELLLRELQKTNKIQILSFYKRRILRIWPLYFLVLLILFILGKFLPDISTNHPTAWLAFVFFAGNWYIFKHGWIAGPIDPLWSIAVEEQFYLAIPLLIRWGGKRVLLALSILLLLISVGVNIYYARLTYQGESGQWLNSWFQFQFFAAGALLTLTLNGKIPDCSLALRILLFAAGLIIWYWAVALTGVKSYDGHPTISGALIGWTMVLTGTVLFCLAFLGLKANLVPTWLVYLGRISFGLYMFHSTVFHFVFQVFKSSWQNKLSSFHLSAPTLSIIGTLLVLTITIALAAISYRFFERPFLRLKEKLAIIPSRPE